MKRIIRQKQRPAATDLLEEATHVLRAVPAAAFVCYYAGALPFVLGLVYFWADMSLSPLARGHDAEAALGLAGLYVWMKFWQNVFARRLCAQIAGVPPAPWSLGRVQRVLVTQMAVQPLGLLLAAPPLLLAWTAGPHLRAVGPLLPLLAYLFLAPCLMAGTLFYAAPLAFFQNLTILDDGVAQPLRRPAETGRPDGGIILADEHHRADAPGLVCFFCIFELGVLLL